MAQDADGQPMAVMNSDDHNNGDAIDEAGASSAPEGTVEVSGRNRVGDYDIDDDDDDEEDVESGRLSSRRREHENNHSVDADDDAADNEDEDNLQQDPQQQQRLRPLQVHAQQLRHRLLRNQRNSILLQVLFHHILNTRRRREEEETAASVPPPLPDRPLPVLSQEEAMATGAICRFCLEGAVREPDCEQEEEEGEGEHSSINQLETAAAAAAAATTTITTTGSNIPLDHNVLIAPCNCSGGSRWVHLFCLQQWQRMQARTTSSSALFVESDPYYYGLAGYVCNVCTSPYLSRPPVIRSVRHNILKRGTLLVSKNILGRTFQQTVVLLLNDVCAGSGAFGLIINAPLQHELTPNLLSSSSSAAAAAAATATSEQALTEAEQTGIMSVDRTVDNILADTLADTTAGTEASSNVEEADANNRHAAADNLLQNDTAIGNVMNGIDWRRGGPVCGGRLGVVQYVIMHTFSQQQATATAAWGGSEGAAVQEQQHHVMDVDIDEDYVDDETDGDEDVVPNEDAGDAGDIIDAVVVEEYPEVAPPSVAGHDASSNSSVVSQHQHHNHPHDDDDNDTNDDNHHSRSGPDEDCAPISLPIFDLHRNTHHPPLQFVASNNSQQPATFSEETLVNVVQRLVASSDAQQRLVGDEHDPSGTTAARRSSEVPRQKIMVFSGYCKWRAGQLEREIQRESWGVCINGTAEDILRDHDSGFWEELSESERLLSWQRLVEDDFDHSTRTVVSHP